MASISGLSSGLDTSTIISQLMQLERIPQARLQSKQSSMESSIGSLRTLNAKFASIVGVAEKLGARLDSAVVPSPSPPNPWQLTTASSNDVARTTATAVAGAPAGSLTFNVRQLATAASHLSGVYTGTAATLHTDAGSVVEKTFTLTKGTGTAATSTTITTANGTLAETVEAINAVKAGVTASMVQTEPGKYRLQLTSTTTGAQSALTLTTTDNTDVLKTTSVAGRNAIIDLGGNTPVERPTNTFSDVLEGVTLTLTKADTNTAAATDPPVYTEAPVTITITKDTDGIASRVQALVDAANAARSDAKSLTAVDPVSKAKGRLYGESTVRGLVDQVRSAVPGNAIETSKAGITVDRNGVIQFDKAKFLARLAEDPAATELAIGEKGLAGRLHKLADQVSRGVGAEGGAGVITNTITSKESQISSLKSNIEGWDRRLEMKERMLERQYTALETALGRAQSQGQWLSSQLANLPTWGN